MEKTIYKGSLVFEVLTNLDTTIPLDIFVTHLRYVLNHINPKLAFDVLKVDDDNEDLIKMDFGEYRKDVNSTEDDESTGRWWGVINRSFYHCKEATKKEAPLSKIISKEIVLNKEEAISPNIYKK